VKKAPFIFYFSFCVNAIIILPLYFLFFRNEEVIFCQEDDLIKEERTNIVKIRNYMCCAGCAVLL